MEMKTLGIAMGAMVLLCLGSPVGAEPRDSVDRGSRLDTDAIRDDVRINRLKVPTHPLTAEQPPAQQQPVSAPKAKPKSKKSGDIR
ncbi:MAG: hypothetical protein WCA28_18480 [Bradyrhizobium sp.]